MPFMRQFKEKYAGSSRERICSPNSVRLVILENDDYILVEKKIICSNDRFQNRGIARRQKRIVDDIIGDQGRDIHGIPSVQIMAHSRGKEGEIRVLRNQISENRKTVRHCEKYHHVGRLACTWHMKQGRSPQVACTQLYMSLYRSVHPSSLTFLPLKCFKSRV